MSFDNSRIVVLGAATIGSETSGDKTVSNIPAGTTHFIFEGTKTHSHSHVKVGSVQIAVAPGIPYAFGRKSSQVVLSVPAGSDGVTGIVCCQLAPY
jgi:hypothetical protein